MIQYILLTASVLSCHSFSVTAESTRRDLSGLSAPGQKISISQVINPDFNKTLGGWGPAAYRYALSKYGINVPITNEKVGTLKGSVAANPGYANYDREYLSPVSIGNPPQTLLLDIDTGSADLWVFSQETPRVSVATGKAIYNATNSSSSRFVPGATWSITYGDGSSCGGSVFTDTVTIGPLSVPNHPVESAQRVSEHFVQDVVLSGLVGLSFRSANQIRPGPRNTWFDSIKDSLAAPLFTANLKKSAPGTYDFGYIDSTKYIGNITYVPITPRYSLWEFTCSGYAIGMSSSAVLNNTPLQAVADTGTSLLLLPSSIVTSYYQQIPRSYFESAFNAYLFPCAATLPAFVFGVGNARQMVPGKYMNYGQVSSDLCYGGIQSQGSLPFSIFGDIALKAQFVVFDMNGPRIGWANKVTS